MTLRVVGSKRAKRTMDRQATYRLPRGFKEPMPIRRGPWKSAIFTIEYRKQTYNVVWTQDSCEVIPLGSDKRAQTYPLDREDKPRVTDSIQMIERYLGKRGSRAQRRMGRR